MNLSKHEQGRILRKSFSSSKLELEEVLLVTDADNVHDGKILVGLFDYLKRHPVQTAEMRSQFCEIIQGICGENLEDEDFFEYLCRKIGKRKATMNSILKNTEQRGQKKLSTEPATTSIRHMA